MWVAKVWSLLSVLEALGSISAPHTKSCWLLLSGHYVYELGNCVCVCVCALLPMVVSAGDIMACLRSYDWVPMWYASVCGRSL